MSCLRGLRTTRAAFTTYSSGRGSKCHKELMSPHLPPAFLHASCATSFCKDAGKRATCEISMLPAAAAVAQPSTCPPCPLSGVFQANYTITTTRQACFLDGVSRGEGGGVACRTSKCHEKCMSCCCSSKCRQRLIIPNWVNGSSNSSSISSASGSVLCKEAWAWHRAVR